MDKAVEDEVKKRIFDARRTGNLHLDLSWIASLTEIPASVTEWQELRGLDLSDTEIVELSALSRLTNLRRLVLDDTSVSDLTPLKNLSYLSRLDLDRTAVSDLTPLEELPNLRELSLHGVSGLNLQPLISKNADLQIYGQGSPSTTISELEHLREKLSEYVKEQDTFRDYNSGIRKLVTRNSNELEKLNSAIEDSRHELAEYKEASDGRIAQVEKDYRESMEAAARAFSEDQAIAAPVELWKGKQAEHEKTRDAAFWRFVAGLAVIAGFAGVLIYTMATNPDQTNALFAPVGCDLSNPTAEACKGLSLRGMLSSALALTVLTILLWFARLQMKLYLAERHLVLDARERRAFAETYVGLLKEGDTSKEASEQRALVYSALFRPSSDGTIKEEGGLDPTITAALSKLLSR